MGQLLFKCELLLLIFLLTVCFFLFQKTEKKSLSLPFQKPAKQSVVAYLPGNQSNNFINQFAKPPTLDVQITTSSVVVSIINTVKQIINPLPKKSSYILALFGDSMVQTMGEDLPYLQKELTKKYPQIKFQLYNFGVGSENVGQGLVRFSQQFQNFKPDILIIGSFAYNPYYPYNREKYINDLTQLLTKAKEITSNVYLLVEIAPLKRGFGQGNQGVNWPVDQAYEHATHIIESLESAITTAKNLQIPVIDVFSISQVNSEKEGNKKYVNSSDGIHPSITGHQFMAEQIAKILFFGNLSDRINDIFFGKKLLSNLF